MIHFTMHAMNVSVCGSACPAASHSYCTHMPGQRFSLPKGSCAGKQRLGTKVAASCTEAAIALVSSSVVNIRWLAIHDARLQQLLRPFVQQRLRCVP